LRLLRGKSPHVVLADAGDLDALSQAIGWRIFYNAGQSCHAGSRVLVGVGRVEPVPGGAYMEPTVLEALDPWSSNITTAHYTHLKTTWVGL
jgi:Aldehyde dehydrogenase family